MVNPRAACMFAALLLPSLLDAGSATAQTGARDEGKKPSLSLKATPPISFSPARVRASVEVRGGPDDYQDFYCPTIEWDWGDGTMSESTEDCDPYEPGKSSIRRRFSAEHVYRQAGYFKLMFRLKRKDKTIAATNVSVQVRPGLRDPY
jgi:hypothetical protein